MIARHPALRLCAALLVVGALSACSTTADETAETELEGGMSEGTLPGDGMATTGTGTRGGIDEVAPLDRDQPPPGSQAELEISIGDRVLFETDSSELTLQARDTLEQQAAWLRRYPNVRLVLEGHADERGTREYNLALGERRATAVRNYLIALGIAPDRLRTVSYGKERPAVLGSGPQAWAQNRRAVSRVE